VAWNTAPLVSMSHAPLVTGVGVPMAAHTRPVAASKGPAGLWKESDAVVAVSAAGTEGVP